MKASIKTLLICSSGGVVELYDFIIYALMANYLARLFFPMTNPLSALMATFATFAIGYIVRPVGGIVFGHFGDRYGRKKSFTMSVLLMAISTLLLGLVPTYTTWGIWAPISMVVLRLFQGFSVGGEIPGGLTYVSEWMPERKMYACAILFSGVMCGLVLGSLVNSLLNTIFTTAQIAAWAWRLPFLLGALLGFVSFFLRKYALRSELFVAVESTAHRWPIWHVCRQYGVNAWAGITLVGFAGSTTVLYFLFTPAYVSMVLHQPLENFLWFKLVSMLLAAVVSVYVGSVGKDWDNRFTMQLLLVAISLLTYVIFYIYVMDFNAYLWALALSCVLNGVIWGRLPGILVSLYPTRIRYSGIGFSYNIGFGLLAGFTPLVATVLIKWTEQALSPAYYLSAQGVIALLSVIPMKTRELIEEDIRADSK